MESLVSLAKEHGLTGLLVMGLCWVLPKVTPHITAAVVADRDNKRKSDMAYRQFEAKLEDRRAKAARKAARSNSDE